MQDDRESARQDLDNQGQEQDQAHNQDDDQHEQPKEKAPPMNVFSATGVALFKGPAKSKINKPEQGETKRSFRLLRLMLVLGIGVASLFIVVGFLRKDSYFGPSKYIGALLFLILALRCFYVFDGLWRKLR